MAYENYNLGDKVEVDGVDNVMSEGEEVIVTAHMEDEIRNDESEKLVIT